MKISKRSNIGNEYLYKMFFQSWRNYNVELKPSNLIYRLEKPEESLTYLFDLIAAEIRQKVQLEKVRWQNSPFLIVE